MPDDRDAIYKLAYDEGTRVIGDQVGALEKTRNLVAAIIGTATTATAFLVGIVVRADGNERDRIFYIGIIGGLLLFAGMMWRCFEALQPKYVWHFNLSPKTIIDGYADHDEPATLPETHRALALILQENIDHNQVNLDRLRKLSHQALVLLVLELAWWTCLTVKVA